MVKRSEIGEAWFQGSGLSVGSETLGPSSRLSRPAPSLQMQSVGATKTATLTVLQYHARAVRSQSDVRRWRPACCTVQPSTGPASTCLHRDGSPSASPGTSSPRST